jgi:pyridoxamine 5'-phosphate oxidase family protein
MSFTAEELAYLRSQGLARLATVSADGQPDVVPVAFELDGSELWVGDEWYEARRAVHDG